MRFWLAEATTALPFVLLVGLTGSGCAHAQVDYLAPIAGPAGSPCEDTAPDCADVCSAHSGSASPCSLSTPIGTYLRCSCTFQVDIWCLWKHAFPEASVLPGLIARLPVAYVALNQ